jgi:hypothetical protein
LHCECVRRTIPAAIAATGRAASQRQRERELVDGGNELGAARSAAHAQSDLRRLSRDHIGTGPRRAVRALLLILRRGPCSSRRPLFIAIRPHARCGLSERRLGIGVAEGASVRLGISVSEGASVRLGISVSEGASVRLGIGVSEGASVRLGIGVSEGASVRLGIGVSEGASVRLGIGVSEGARVIAIKAIHDGTSDATKQAVCTHAGICYGQIDANGLATREIRPSHDC